MRAEDFHPPSPSQKMTARVEAAFIAAGGFTCPRVSWGYRLGMLGVLPALVVLPLVYLLMIAGACWLLLWHVRHDIVWFEYADAMSLASPRMFLMVGLAYLGITIAGAISILFLIKPLFAPPPEEPPPVTLDPLTEPALFALIHRICDLMGAPRPTEVQVDCRVNASASFRRGMASFFGHDLVLTIGMPLVAGLSVQQLAGVLAHEFGHFAQGGGMRVAYLVRSIQHWFARVVHERDPWDYKLDSLEEGGTARRFVGVTAKAMIWLGRLLLGWLMNVGGALSGALSRQMEYDADAHAARVVGSRTCMETQLRLPVLDEAQAMVGHEMFTLLKSGSLPDNVPCRMSRHEQGMAEPQREKLRRKALAEHADWWDTHPTLAQRREALAELAAPGMFHLEDPAQALFTDYTTLCQAVSFYWYEVEIGLDLNQFELVDLTGMAAAGKQPQKRETHDDAVRELFGRLPPLHRLTPLPGSAAAATTTADHAAQVALVEAWKDGYEAACAQEKHLRNTALNLTLGCHLAQHGLPLQTLARLEMSFPSLEAATHAQAQSLQAYHACSGQLQRFEQAAWARIAAALEQHYQALGTRQDWRQRVGLLVAAQRALATAVQHLVAAAVDVELVAHASPLQSATQAQAHADTPLQSLLRQHDQRVHATLLRVIEALGTAADPFTEKPQRLSETLRLADLSNPDAYYAIDCYPPLLRALHEHAALVTGELCAMTREVEREALSAAMQMQARASTHQPPQRLPTSTADWQSAPASMPVSV